MGLTGNQETWLYVLIGGLFYICLLFILAVQVQIVFERTLLLIFLAAGVSLILSMVLNNMGVNIKKFRFLPLEIYGRSISVTFFILAAIILKVLIG